MIDIYYSPGFAAPIGPHIMPIGKFALVADRLRGDPRAKLIEPPPVSVDDLLRVHTGEYVEAVRTGEPRELAESQKFPWSPQLFDSVRLTNGGVLAAARAAMRGGIAGALVSGFHHANPDHGEGFCTFNGLAVAAEALRAAGEIKRCVAVLDMDLHYGNGTAVCCRGRPWLRQLSIYGNDYWANTPYRDVTVRQHEDGANHVSAALPAGCDGAALQAILAQQLPWLLSPRPDVILYQAGADPYREDPYSPLNLDHADLLERDRTVFRFARTHGIPIAWVLAGGYTADVSKVVQVHVNTFEAACDVFLAPLPRGEAG